MASQDVSTKYHEFILALRDEMKRTHFIDRVEYVGSMYKGTSIGSSDFDNLFVKRSQTIVALPSAKFPDHAILCKRRRSVIIEPDKRRNHFKGEIQRAVNRLGMAGTVKLVDSGPAVAAEYYPNGWRNYGSSCLFSADLDYCLEVPMKGNRKGPRKLYVAKKPKGATGNDIFAWKVTTDLVEKEKISTIDAGNGIGRLAVRILKGLKKEPTLSIFKSCMFEQVLYHLKEQHPDPDFWKESNLSEVIKTMLDYIIRAIRRGTLEHHFMSENMLPSMSPATKENVLNRLEKFARNPESVID